MKTIELQEKYLGGIGSSLIHYFANGKRIEKSQYIAIKNEAINNGKYLNNWESKNNGVSTFGQYVSVRAGFVY